MAPESGRRSRRRLILLGLLLLLIPITTKDRDQQVCQTHSTLLGSLACTPIDLLRILGPLARYLLV